MNGRTIFSPKMVKKDHTICEGFDHIVVIFVICQGKTSKMMTEFDKKLQKSMKIKIIT